MLYDPHPAQLKAHNDPARFKVLNWARRTGKSTFAVNFTIWEALKKYERYVKEGKTITGPFNYFIVGPTYRQTKSIFWEDIIKTQVPRAIIDKSREDELRIEIPHHETDFGVPKMTDNAKDLPAITVSLKGAENEDSLRGVKLSGVVLDEYAFMKPLVWEKIIRPALADERGWAIFISTPNGFNHFYDLAEFAKEHPNWFYSHATIYDNPFIPREEIEEIKQGEFAKDEDGNTWYQEYMADFRQMSGLVFKEFSRKPFPKGNICKLDEIPLDGTNLIGIDFGYENPFAAVFVRIDHDNNWWVYDLVYERHMSTEEAIGRLRDKMTGQYFSAIVGDSASAQEIANFRSRNFPIKGASKRGSGRLDSISAGIRMIADKLKPQLTMNGVRPKLIIREDLKPLILEFETYRYYDPNDAGRMVNKDRPMDENNHGLDALRYLMLEHFQHRQATPERKRIYDPVTGRPLD